MSYSRPLRQPRKARVPLVVILTAALLAGCSHGVENGALPSTPEITNQTGTIITLWNGSWIAALSIGVITWGLILWCVAVYRKRKDDTKLPVQNRVHLPLEIMYTLVPIMAVGVLFKYTAEDIVELTDLSATPDIEIQVVGKQWSWDFNYLSDDVYDPGVQAQLTGDEGVEETLPTLYLPVDERVHFYLDSRDVIHSFWIPSFLYKVDTVPGRTNEWQVTPTQIGVYQGKCAELCGEYHASMLFNVAVVERAEYDARMEELRDQGYEGSLGLEYSRDQVVQMVTEAGEDA